MHENTLSHLGDDGKPQMVDVNAKEITHRIASAQTLVHLPPDVMSHFSNDDIQTKKGAVFQTAILAGVMAVKKTSDLIPLCHPLAINKCDIDISRINESDIKIVCTVQVDGKTGVEMEALTGASMAALTIYDMCKALSHNIVIRETKLLAKRGGKNDFERN